MEHVQVAELEHRGGVDDFKKRITDAYEPIEDYRVGKVMDEVFETFCRKPGQEIVD